MRFEIPKQHGKLLVLCEDQSYLAYKLGKYNIYIEHFRMLQTQKNMCAGSPSIVRIRFKKKQDIVDFIENEASTIKAWRVFKAVGWAKIPKTRGFQYRCAGNFLGLFPGKTLRIKSSNVFLRNAFYAICEELNKKLPKEKRVSFDYDKYDAELILKDYITRDKKYWIVIIAGKGFEELPEN